MILYIDTASYDTVKLEIKQGNKSVARKKFKAPKRQAERLLPELGKFLQAKSIKLKNIKKIIVANQGGSFTSLRIGVVTANALAYALKIPIETTIKPVKRTKKFAGNSIVEPIYDQEPAIGGAKKQ